MAAEVSHLQSYPSKFARVLGLALKLLLLSHCSEFVMELRPAGGRSASAGRRRSSSDHRDRDAGGSGGQLRDPDTALLYSAPDVGYGKGAWPQLVAYDDARDGKR